MTHNISPNNKSISFFSKDHVINTETGSQYWVPMKTKVQTTNDGVIYPTSVTSMPLTDPVVTGSFSLNCKCPKIIVGDRIRTSNGALGTVAYVGELHYKPGDYAGIVLDEEIGNCNGSVNGKMYFQCPPRRGIFCLLNTLTLDVGGSVAEQPAHNFHLHPHRMNSESGTAVSGSLSPSPLRTLSFSPPASDVSPSSNATNDMALQTSHSPNKSASQVNPPIQHRTASKVPPSQTSVSKSGPIVIDSRRAASSTIPSKSALTPRTISSTSSRLTAPKQIQNLSKELPSNASSAEELGHIMPPNNDHLVQPQVKKQLVRPLPVGKAAPSVSSRVPTKPSATTSSALNSTTKARVAPGTVPRSTVQKPAVPSSISRGAKPAPQAPSTRTVDASVKRVSVSKPTSATSTATSVTRKPAVSAPSSASRSSITSRPAPTTSTLPKKAPPAKPANNKSMPSVRAPPSSSGTKLQRGATLVSQSATTLKSPPASRADVRGSYASVRTAGKPLRPAPSAVLPPASKPLSARTPQQKRTAASVGTVREPPLLPSSSSLQMSSSELNETDRLFAQRMTKKIDETREAITALKDAIYYSEIQNAATLREIIASLRSQHFLENKRSSYIAKLTPKQQGLVRELEECKAANQQLKMDIHRTEDDLEAANRMRHLSQERIKQLRHQIEMKENELSKITSDNELKRNHVVAMKERCEELQKQLVTLATRNGQATRDLIKHQEELSALPRLSDGLSLQQRKIQCSDLESNIATVRATLQTRNTALKVLQDSIIQFEKDYVKDLQSASKLKDSIETFKVKMREDPRQAEILRISDEIDLKDQQIAKTNAQLDSARAKLTNAMSQCDDIAFQSLEEAETMELETAEMVKKLESELKHLTLAVKVADKDLQDSKERHAAQTSDFVSRSQRDVLLEQEKVTNIHARINSIRTDLTNKRETTSSYSSQCQTLQTTQLREELKSIEVSKAAVSTAKMENMELEKENAKIRGTVVEVIKFSDRVRQQIQQLQRENDLRKRSTKQLQEQVSLLEKKKNSLDEESHTRRSECDQLRKSISTLMTNRSASRRTQIASLWKWAAFEAMQRAREKFKGEVQTGKVVLKKEQTELEALQRLIQKTGTELQLRKDLMKNHGSVDVAIQEQNAISLSLRQKLHTIKSEKSKVETSIIRTANECDQIRKLDAKIPDKEVAYLKELQEECNYSTHRLRELSHKTQRLVTLSNSALTTPSSPLSPNFSPLSPEAPSSGSIVQDSTIFSALNDPPDRMDEESVHFDSMDQVTERLTFLNQTYLDLLKENDYLSAELETLEEMGSVDDTDTTGSVSTPSKCTPTIARPVVRPSQHPVNRGNHNQNKAPQRNPAVSSRPSTLSIHNRPSGKSVISSPLTSPRGTPAARKNNR